MLLLQAARGSFEHLRELALAAIVPAFLAGCAPSGAMISGSGGEPESGAGVGAAIPVVSVIEGAVAGAPISGPGGPVWADADGDGRVDGYIYDGRYYAGPPSPGPGSDPWALFLPPPPPPPPPPAPDFPTTNGGGYATANGGAEPSGEGGEEGVFIAGSRNPTYGASWRYAHAAALPLARRVAFSSIQAWHSNNGTLTKGALTAMLQECVAEWEGVTSECQAAVRAGAGNFSQVPESARREFVLLFRDGCPEGREEAACANQMQTNRVFRSLPRGRFDPRPLQMHEGQRTRFTAFIRDHGEIEGSAGIPTDVGSEPDPNRPGQRRRIEVIPYSARMCFRLYSDDPRKVRIEPMPQQRATIEQDRVCMKVAEWGGAIRYDPSWWVTPLKGDDLKLYLDSEHYVGSEKRDFMHEPRPIEIDVVPKPSWWDRLDAFLKRATGTVNLAIGLAEAIGLLIAAISGWGIWTLVKKWRAARRRPPERGEGGP